MSVDPALFGTANPVALVTGSGAPRIGNFVARYLAARGYRIVIHANRSFAQAQGTAESLRASGSEAIALTAELSDPTAVRDLVRDAYSHFGRIDALVNCAAIWEKKRLEQVEADDVRRHFEANTLGTFLISQQVGLKMVEQETGGCIIHFGDWASHRPYLDYAAYFHSKGAVEVMTRNFAIELAERNPRVRVNAILPGPVMLPPELSEAERTEAIAGTLVRREGSPRHVADAVRFLLENDFITGVCLPVDGGRTLCAR